MVNSYTTFYCKQCGECCKRLIFKDLSVMRGLTLLPEEVVFFPPEQVAPAIGLGISPLENPFKVLTYQLMVDICPRIRNNYCTIYENRPSSCRQFPFTLDLDKNGETIIGFDLNCPEVSKFVEAGIPIMFEEIIYAEKLLDIKRVILSNANRVWLFDLEKMDWVKMMGSL